MRKTWIGAAFVGALFSAICSPTFAAKTLKQVEAAALSGDYQAQRNLAYGYVAFPYTDQVRNPILGCAWYLVVLNSGSPKVDSGDVGNVKVYCFGLEELQQRAALAQGRLLYEGIYGRAAAF